MVSTTTVIMLSPSAKIRCWQMHCTTTYNAVMLIITVNYMTGLLCQHVITDCWSYQTLLVNRKLQNKTVLQISFKRTRWRGKNSTTIRCHQEDINLQETKNNCSLTRSTAACLSCPSSDFSPFSHWRYSSSSLACENNWRFTRSRKLSSQSLLYMRIIVVTQQQGFVLVTFAAAP